MPAFTIDEIVIPTDVGDADAADYVRCIEIGNAVEAIGYGTEEIAYEPAEELTWFHSERQPRRMLAARVDGEVVARAVYETTLGDGADSAWLTVDVLPGHRDRGIGGALADAVEQLARDDAKSKALVYVPIPEAPGPRLSAPTGYGSVRSDDPAIGFLQRRGYRLEQVERLSRLPLPVPDLAERLVAATERSGDDYELVEWIGRTPERWVDDLAVLGTRMSTDAPTAGLEEPEDVWDADRIRAADDRNERFDPRERLTAGVVHRPTGTLVGFSVISVPRQPERAAAQYATLVLREHRGHGLGMLLKVGNLDHLARQRPGHPSVTTFNAEDNRHMLDVNEAVGFVPIGNESAWRKDL
ncbi:MAG TPA: GNAT family N-acetyltransferase [Rhodoglobus sp.]|nr:GNAT family N-acetyltransferase [Rhodoglobus sp.]